MGFLFDLSDPAVLLAVAFLVSIFGLVFAIVAELGRRGRVARLERDIAHARSDLLKLHHTKADFLSIAAHQLRSPLSVIKMGTGALLDGTFGSVRAKRQREALGKILTSVERLIRLTNDYLDVSQMEFGKIECHLAPTDMSKLIREVIAENMDRVKENGPTLSFAGGKFKSRILCDSSKIREVIANLVDNAIKYTKTGSIVVHGATLMPGDVRLPAPVRERGGAMISVQDTGMGFVAEEESLLFQKFRRTCQKGLRRRGCDPVGGSGLGLSIAKMFIEAHGGAIWAKSSGHGRGSFFAFSLPA